MKRPFYKLRYLASCLLFLSLSYGQAQVIQTSHQPWPKIFKPKAAEKIITVQQGDGSRPFIYHTRHFELHSQQAVSPRHLQKFAQVAESVPDVMARIPMPLLAMPKTERPKVYIYPDETSFVQAGGAPGSGGYYSGHKAAILLRADTFLKPPPPAGSKLPPKADYDLLVHEFVHLCMHHKMAYLPVWFTEGVAEYFAAAHVNDGVYRFDQINSAIRRRVGQHLPNDKDHYALPGFQETMQLNHKTWASHLELSQPGDGYRVYGTACLLVHTLFHGGEKRRTATREFLHKLKPRSQMQARVEKLIPAAERMELQERVVKYWQPRGLKIMFAEPLEE